MALRYSTLTGTQLPKQFRYGVGKPKRSSYVPTQGAGVYFQQGGIVQEDLTVQWTCPDSTLAEKQAIEALYEALDPYYLFVGASDQVADRYYVEFNVLDPSSPNDGGLYDLSGSFRVISKATGDATIQVTDYRSWPGKTLTVTVWNGTANVDVVLTEGVDFTAATSDAATAASIAAAIALATGLSASTSADGTVIVIADTGSAISNVTTTATGGATVTTDFVIDWWAYCTGTWTDRMISDG